MDISPVLSLLEHLSLEMPKLSKIARPLHHEKKTSKSLFHPFLHFKIKGIISRNTNEKLYCYHKEHVIKIKAFWLKCEKLKVKLQYLHQVGIKLQQEAFSLSGGLRAEE